ncbi:amphi-Trp domain-containing protein [Halopiger aswanensis]|uniref:Amphi-Trp domain-containing protein n=1 Tax=Halopiger aswanensis TaxID=148449 RepID=A0A419WD61_9EURY|nr:amphi-Trp domain-containing protein [Halopiger aswanensis]RKD93415.1 amphi-Trp domain-containing protein [Halopiger aswanensis]
MAQRTTADETIAREELAAYFHRLAEEFGEGGREINVEVGNKTVELNPPNEVDLSVDVIERSTMFRGDRETIQLELNWKANTNTAPAETDAEAEPNPNSDPNPNPNVE